MRKGPGAGPWLALAAAMLLFPAGCGSPRAGGGTAPVTGARGGSARGKGAAAGKPSRAPASPTRALLGLPPVSARSPLPGYLLIADRDNNRIIVVSPSKRVVWRFPHPGDLRQGQTFAGPDDAFLVPGGRSIITNEEFANTIAIVGLGPRPRITWEYGQAGVQGSAPGLLAHPDDAYLLPNGQVTVADIINCRVLWIDRSVRVVRTIGRAGDCAHAPPATISQPNGDTPLPDGGVMVTEIGGWVDRFDRRGRLRESIRTPTSYPSDAQPLPGGDVLVAGFNTPGRVDILSPRGRVVWTYGPPTGPGALDRPSLAVPLPGGKIAVTDDWHHRVVIIDRRTRRIVWQYGRLGRSGSRAGLLNKPDGLDFIR